MRDEMDPPVYCSDRRIVKAAAMLRTVAASQGKASASLLDCLLLQHVLWYHPDDQKVLRDWLLKRVVPEVGESHRRVGKSRGIFCTLPQTHTLTLIGRQTGTYTHTYTYTDTHTDTHTFIHTQIHLVAH